MRIPLHLVGATLVLSLSTLTQRLAAQSTVASPPLKLELVGSDTSAFDVVATLIIGHTELVASDAHYHVAHARRLADRIAATGKRLKAIIISHPDHDHYAAAAAVVERFPGVPVYMTPKAIAWFEHEAAQVFQAERLRRPHLFPDSLVTPKPLPSLRLTVDGEALEILPDLGGDVRTPSNSVLWIPSLRAALVSDIAFNGVHPWLGSSDEGSRAAWRDALARVRTLRPRIVVAGHEQHVDAPDTPDVLDFMDHYLRDFEALRKESANGDALRDGMLARYPNLSGRVLLLYGAHAAYQASPPR